MALHSLMKQSQNKALSVKLAEAEAKISTFEDKLSAYESYISTNM